MQITVELTLYPLTEAYTEVIREFISRLREYPNLELVTNAASTLIKGEHAYVFDILSKETEKTFAQGQNVFVMKVIGFDRNIQRVSTKSPS